MGWRVCFIGFNRAPPVDRLAGITWLADWRLFEELGTGAWVLEGQSETNGISFFEEIKLADPVPTDAQKAVFDAIETEIKQHKGYREFFDPYTTLIALRLSDSLQQPVAAFTGDDEIEDSSFVFDRGALVRGHVQIDWNKALTFHPGGRTEIEWLYPEGVSDEDPGFKTTRTMYHIALEEADRFFGRHSLHDTLSFDRDFGPDQYLLRAQKGQPTPLPRRPIDELTEQLGPSPTPQRVIDACDPVISAILDPGFPEADGDHRREMSDRVVACVVYAGRLARVTTAHAAFFRRLTKVLSQFSDYAKYMRAKQEFRKSSVDAARWKQELDAQWSRQKRRLQPWWRRLSG